jgi:hypothetical protein
MLPRQTVEEFFTSWNLFLSSPKCLSYAKRKTHLASFSWAHCTIILMNVCIQLHSILHRLLEKEWYDPIHKSVDVTGLCLENPKFP